jgi:leucine-rich repeat protein SHOC2
LSKLSNLETLWIYDMYLTEIPIQFFDLQQVSSIAIDGWRIADLFTGESPEGIRKMNNLKLLRLTTNSQEFSGKAMIDLANFPNLTSLSIKDIPYNKIQHLDTNMNLESLSISHSGIENVPLTISRMQRLKKLGLAGNQISSIPDEVQKLPQLEELSLINNQITTLPLVLLQDRKQVKLFLKQNKITEIPIELFHTNAEKWMISLAENPIEKIPKNVPEAMGLYHGYNRFALNLYHTPLMQQPIMEPWRNKYSWLRITG